MQRSISAAVIALCLLPFVWLVYTAAVGSLGPDPAKALMHSTGEWSLRLLALCLLISPLRAWTGWPGVMKWRRTLGLFAFFYGCIHFVSFLQFYIGWDAAALGEELAERPYITLGFGAWILMLPLAVTSTRKMQQRLRGNWRRLHRLVYLAALLACLHLLWQARSDLGEALYYLGIFAVLLGWRVRRYWLKSRPAATVRSGN
ncbi:Protein-methionine-sulfoxide reductase heme-binding subunit MsrQ [Halioglobus japonicus]|nr:Protein-methionine-sulfoxide reductase heme-binding subunit MsrQ [Halioglobus japonicus]